MLGDIDLTLKPYEYRLFLTKPNKTVIAELCEVYNRKLILKYNALHELSFTLPYSIEINKQFVRNDHVDQLRGHYYIRVDKVDNDNTVLSSDYFYITKPQKSASGGIESLQVQCYLSPYVLRQKTIKNYSGTKTLRQALTETLLVKSNWTIGYIDPEVENVYRTFDESQRTLLDFIYKLAETFDVVVVWDTVNETVNFYKNENLGQNKGLSIEYGKYLKSIDEDPDFDNVVTRLICEGNDGLSIQRLNPTGTNYLEDLSYYLYPFERDENRNVIKHSNYMSDDLCHAQLDYEELLKSKEPVEKIAEVGTTDTNIRITNHGLSNGDYIENITKDAVRKVTVVDANNFTVVSIENQVPTDKILLYPVGTFGKLFFQKEDYQAQLTTLENQMQDLVNELSIILDELDVANANDEDTSTLVTQKNNKQAEIDAKQLEIDAIEANIANVDSQLFLLYDEISVENNFTPEQLIERNQFEIENTWLDTNYTHDEDLYRDGLKKLKAVCQPRINYSIDIVDFLSVIECQREWDKLVLGDIVTVRYPNFGIDIEAKIIEIQQSLDEHSISLTIANAKDIDNGWVKVEEILNNAARSSTQIDMSRVRWNKAVEETSTINEIINSTWSAVEKEIKAGINESVSVSGRGIVLTNPDDPSKMIILQHGLIALSEDSGNTWKTAIQPSGIVAERIFGKLGAFVELDADVVVAGKLASELETASGSQQKLDNFVNDVLEPNLSNLQNQIDGKITTWFYDYAPSANSLPTSDWTTNEIKNKHIGDLFYNTTNGYCYRYKSDYTWERIQDEDIQTALDNASQAQSAADGKITTFYNNTEPSNPSEGDLWINTDNNNELKRYDGSNWISCRDTTITLSLQEAKTYAETQAIEAQQAAEAVAIAQATLAEINANAYADGIVTAEEQARIDEAQANLQEAKTYAETQASEAQQAAQTYADLQVTNFVDEIFNPSLSDLQSEIDGKIVTWFYNYIPSNDTLPTSDWIINGTQSKHVGDLFYNITTGYCYRYKSDYTWEQIQDSDIAYALEQASEAKDAVDNKRQVFVSQPTPPYNVGDLWRDSNTPTDLKICINERLTGSFLATDWELATNVADHVTEQSPHNLPSYCKMQSDGFKVYDSSNNLRCHMGQYATGKYGIEINNGQIYASSFRSGGKTDTNYIEIGSGFSPLEMVYNNKTILEFWQNGGFPVINFSNSSPTINSSQMGLIDALESSNYGNIIDIEAINHKGRATLRLMADDIRFQTPENNPQYGVYFNDCSIASSPTPNEDRGVSLGSSNYRWNYVYCRNVQTGDLGFIETECAICGERFNDGDILCLMVKTIDDEGYTLTIPVHERCKNVPSVLEVEIPEKVVKYKFDKDGVVREYLEDAFDEVEEEIYYVNSDFKLDEDSGVFFRRSTKDLNSFPKGDIEIGKLVPRYEAVEKQVVKTKKPKMKKITIKLNEDKTSKNM